MGCTNRAPPLSLTPKDGARFGRWDRDNLQVSLSGPAAQVRNPRRGFLTGNSPLDCFPIFLRLLTLKKTLGALPPIPHKFFEKSLTKNF